MEFGNGLLQQVQWEGAAQWLYYKVIFEFLHQEIDTFRDNTLHEMMRWVGGSTAVIVVLWLLWYGYRVLQGRVHNAMEGMVDAGRVAFIVTLALTLTIGNGDVYSLLVNELPGEITGALTGENKRAEDMINASLAKMEAAMVALDALNLHGGSQNLETDKDRAQWLAGVGTIGPALTGGALLVMYRMALAL
ncbi:type IV secretion system protein, partial [Lysobacter panacisoli]|uniref:type IV secretion system protein n=2 Tax=Lysobacter panacisoli TaxID=1255263 RepID=UPI0018EF1FFD